MNLVGIFKCCTLVYVFADDIVLVDEDEERVTAKRDQGDKLLEPRGSGLSQ